MPTLDFKGKSFIYTHHLSVPFRELVVDAKKSLTAASDAAPGVHLIALDVTLDGKRYGEWFDAIVDIQP